jgi:hypothetical protein
MNDDINITSRFDKNLLEVRITEIPLKNADSDYVFGHRPTIEKAVSDTDWITLQLSRLRINESGQELRDEIDFRICVCFKKQSFNRLQIWLFLRSNNSKLGETFMSNLIKGGRCDREIEIFTEHPRLG